MAHRRPLLVPLLYLQVICTQAMASNVQCKTCIHPRHSWDTIPVSFHSARDKSNDLGEFTQADMEIITKFPLVTIEKWQGWLAEDSANRSVFLWEQEAMVNAARQIKKASPQTSVIVWFDTMLVYTGWNVDPSNKTVNTTLNPDANAQCATGHFINAEYLERAGKSLLLRNKTKDSDGKAMLAITQYGHCHVYDHSQPAARNYWQSMCLNMTASGVIDGCGADFSAMGGNRWSDHTPAQIAQDLGLDLQSATAWAAGHRQMMKDTQVALGNGLLVGKDGAELGDHVNAVIDESGCYRRNSTVNNLRALTQRRKENLPASQQWVYQCHGRDFTNHTLAAFLAGAGDGHYLTVGSWHGGAQGHWSNDLSRPLGPPLAEATYNGTSWHREFESGTKVIFTPHTNAKGRDMGGVGEIIWGNKPLGGGP